MSAYARARGHEVVFDGADLPVDDYPRKGRAGVRAVFPDPGEKADHVPGTALPRDRVRSVGPAAGRTSWMTCDGFS